jgi:predicted metalloprotease with PDZ domain
MRLTLRRATLPAALALAMAFSGSSALAQDLPAPVDQPYQGTLGLTVDLTDAPKNIYHVRETIPVASGPLTLFYPKWIPGEHSPSGPIQNVAGVQISANGKPLAWRRDLKEMYALHLDVPAGVDKLDIAFEFLAPRESGGFSSSPSSTPNFVALEFNQVAFYPAGYYTSRIMIQPTVKLPAGWKFASSLETDTPDSASPSFKAVSFENLVDSPLIAGRHFNRVDLAPGDKTAVHLNIVGDSAASVKATDKQIAGQRALIVQANKLFGAHHYSHYDFLLINSDHTQHFGLEHHQSSDDRLFANFLTDNDVNLAAGTLLPHEYVHSWNGKFRRPADLWTPTFTETMQDDLLWVYEGLTDYWCGVLAARSGIWTTDQWRDSLASISAGMSNRTGRSWRSLQDTADAAPLTYAGGGGWSNYRRGTDFYPEGQLLWLDVDTKIRDLSGGKHSLDDFARAFYGMDNGEYGTKTYTFEDVVGTLNSVQPFDWASFLRQRLDATGNTLPEHGIENGGWKVVYDDKPSGFDKTAETIRKSTNLAYSLGVQVNEKGVIQDVQWDGTAAKAGLVPGLTIVAVNGKDFSGQVLKDAVTDAKSTTTPIEFLVKNIGEYTTVKVDYHGGLKYPHLVRGDGKDLIGVIATPRK